MPTLEQELAESINNAVAAADAARERRYRAERNAKRKCAKCGAGLIRTSPAYLLCPCCPDARLVPYSADVYGPMPMPPRNTRKRFAG